MSHLCPHCRGLKCDLLPLAWDSAATGTYILAAGVAHLSSLYRLTSLNLWNCLRVTGELELQMADADTRKQPQLWRYSCGHSKDDAVSFTPRLLAQASLPASCNYMQVSAPRSPRCTPCREWPVNAAPLPAAGGPVAARLPAAAGRLPGAPGGPDPPGSPRHAGLRAPTGRCESGAFCKANVPLCGCRCCN